MTDQERASFVTQEYRKLETLDTNVKAAYPNAQDIEVSTNLDSAGAAQYAASMFARLSPFTETYTVSVQGVYRLDDLVAQPLRYTLAHDRYPNLDPNKARTAIGYSIDYASGRTTLTVMG